MKEIAIYFLLIVSSVILGLAAIGIALTINRTIQARKSWRRTKGKVKSRIIEKISDSDTGDSYCLSIEVEFEENGKVYICNKIYTDYSPRFKTILQAKEYMKNIFVGNEVDCFFNPINPLESVIYLKSHYLNNFLALLVVFTCLYQVWNISFKELG